MSHYSDAEESIHEVPDLAEGLRKRKLWDPEAESITSEIKDLLEEDDLVSVLFIYRFIDLHTQIMHCSL